MPTNERIGAFVLFYEYVRLDMVGTIPALTDFLQYGRDQRLEEPIQYFLKSPGQEARRLALTSESRRVWERLKDSDDLNHTLQPAENPLASSWIPSDMQNHLLSMGAAGEEFVLFSSVSSGPAYTLAAEAEVHNKFMHQYYVAWATNLQVQCVAVRPATPIERLLVLNVTPPENITRTSCQGQECYVCEAEAPTGTSWNVTVTAVDHTQRVQYKLNGIPEFRGPNEFNPFAP